MRLSYRPEIDGLRAIAVIPVILFHAGFRTFRGGFVGVDVFFVISGYLITSLIVGGQEAGDFSLLGFYERRARRILPALFVVMFACLPFAWLWLFPPDLRRFSQSLVAVAGFASNIWFWRLGGYFEAADDLKPLLHTWSLGVEEQFYLLFPLLLIATRRLGRRWIAVVLATAALASFALAQWSAPRTAFYLLQARAWELLCGGLLGLLVARPRASDHDSLIKEASSAAGLLLIIYGVLSFDGTMLFRSIYTLIPISGACLIIANATPRTVVGRLLGSRVLVGVGLISYSAYLWHQPLFAFARHRSLAEPSVQLMSGLSVVTLVLAYLTWKYVETPFRERHRIDRTRVLVAGGSCSLLFAAIGSIGYLSDGFPSRLPEALTDALRRGAIANPRTASCDADDAPRVRNPDNACVFGSDARVVGAIVGDSHANALAYALGEAFGKREMGIKEMAYSGVPFWGHLDDANAKGFQSDVFRVIRGDDSFKYVVLASRWTLYFPDESPLELDATTQAYAQAVSAYLKLGRTVFLVYPVPETRSPKELFFGRYAFDTDQSTSYLTYKSDRKVSATIAAFDRLGEYSNLVRIRPDRMLCDTVLRDRCVVERDGLRLYADEGHLSIDGARILVDEIMKHVDER